MKDHFLVAIGSAVLGMLILCTTLLVALGKVDGDLYFAAVVSPIVGGLIGAVSVIKGVQSGSEATVSPPPDA